MYSKSCVPVRPSPMIDWGKVIPRKKTKQSILYNLLVNFNMMVLFEISTTPKFSKQIGRFGRAFIY